MNRTITRSDIFTLLNYATQVGLALQSLKAHEQILNLTVTDPLTGLRNRRFFDQALDMEIKRCQRYGRSCCLVMGDLDHFKRINDRYGHAAGDEVLKLVANLLRDSVRSVDIVFWLARRRGRALISKFMCKATAVCWWNPLTFLPTLRWL